MSLYNLISTGSGEIVNIFEWNGMDQIFIPPGFTTELNTTESIQIPYGYDVFESMSFVLSNELTDIFIGDLTGNVKADYVGANAILTNNIIMSGSAELTGSVNITGSLFINDKSLDTILEEKNSNISLNQYGRLKFEAEQNFNSTSLIIPNYIDVSEAPKSTYFRFNKNKAGNLWNNPDPSVSVITLSLLNLGEGYEGFWRELVDDIFKTNTSGYELTLSSVEYPNTYKTFRIITGTVYQKIFRGSNASPLYSKWKMGEVGTILSDTVIAELRFENEHQYSLAEGYIEYVEFEVTEVESSVDQNRDPIHDDEFTIGFTKNPVKRKQVFEFTSTTTPWKVPAWADELTIYSIGAGGGGGGGASGHGLHLIRDFHEKSSVYVKSYNGIDFSNHKILLKNNLQLLSETDLEMIEFMDKSGHMYVTGGGGGAGGNVAISKIKISDGLIDSNDIGKNIIPRQSKLNIYVGSGGFGGEGSSYKDDLDIELFGGLMRNGIHNEFVFIQDVNGNPIPDAYRMRLSNWYLSRLGMKFKLTNYGQLANIGESHLIIPSWNNDQYHPDSTQMSFYPEYYPSMVTPSGKLHHKKMTSDNVKHFGKRGGFSSVELTEESNTVTNTSIEMIRATGGYGGLAGWGLTAHSSDIHRLCSSFGHQFQHFFIPGGGSSIDSSFGNIEVRPGGHGGYGISLPSIEKVPDSKIFNVKRNYRFGDYPMNRIAEDEAKFRGYEYENSRDYTRSTKMKIHIAPSIPWNSNANNRFQTNEFGDKTLGYTLPWGSTVDVDYSNWENDGHRIYDTTSQLTPNLPAPLGGNGGIGVTWFGLDNSYPYDVHSVDESLNYFNYVGPDEPNGATVDFGNIPSYIERVLFSKINGVVITSNDVEDYFPPRDVFEVQQSRIANNIIFDSDTVAIIEGSSTLVSTVTRTTSNANGYYSFDIGDQGANGGFGVYQTTDEANNVSFDNDGIEVPAENGRWYGYGGGGGAAAYITDWNEKDTANVKGQDGANGAGGIVIIVAEEL